MEAKIEESSLWPYWTGAWPDSHLLEEEALLSGLSLPSLHFHPSCSTITSNNILQGELDAIFEDDVLRHWDDMEQSGNKVEEEGNERLPLLCYTEEKEVSSNTKVVVRAAGQQVRSSEEPVLTFELVSQYFASVLQEAGKAVDEEQLRAVVEMLQQEKQLLEQRPYVQLDEKTKRLRQACFKANYKKRRLLALKGGEAPRIHKY
ncbi:uncharacterized protein [Miscanthus floridulus]|uniref:uncharacterized protein n=1 Tax=Miscanthus floridulus TaxID=154761 RepID=UPI0034581BD1